MPAFSNAELALKLSDLVDYWSTFNTEYSNWLGGTVTGGPSSDGKFPLTNWGGDEILVECPAKLSDNVGGFADAADASAIAAAASAVAANQSDIDAAAEAVVATAQAVLADADRVAAESAATASSGSASTATTQANLALTRVGYASEWAITIEDTLVSVAAGGNGTTDYSSLHWAAKSAASAGTASGYETAAAASAAAAAQSDVDAALEKTYSQEWATKAEDVFISTAAGGDGATHYSSYHWAQKSEDLGAAQVALAAIEVTNAAAQVTLAAAEVTNAATEVTYAEEWAIKGEDVLVSVAAGGNGTTEYSAYHWAQKAEDFAISADPASYVRHDGTTPMTGNLNLNNTDILTGSTYLDVVSNHATIGGVRAYSTGGIVGYLYGDSNGWGLLNPSGAWVLHTNNTTLNAQFYADLTVIGAVTGSNLNVTNWDSAYTITQRDWNSNPGLSSRVTLVPDTVGDTSGVTYNYLASGASPKPAGMSDGALETRAYNSNWQTQMLTDWRYNGRIWIRGQDNNVWTGWAQVWSSADFADNSADWDAAFVWGDHALGGYAALADNETITGAWSFDNTVYMSSTAGLIITDTLDSHTLTLRTNTTYSQLLTSAGDFYFRPATGRTRYLTSGVDAAHYIYAADGSTYFRVTSTAAETALITNSPQINIQSPLLATSITASGTVTGSNLNVTNWDNAFGWGDHSGLYSLVAHVHEGTEIDATAVTDGYVLTADGAGNSAWEILPASVTSFDELTDTTVTAVTAGEVITWSGTAWINETLAEAGIQPAGAYLTAVVASDVNAEASIDGYVLTSDGAGNAAWEVPPAGGAGGAWVLKTASYTLVAGDQINVEATSAAATMTVPATIAANAKFTVHNQTTSTKVVDVAPNTGHTIVGALGSAVGGTDTIQVRPGETIYLVAVSTTVLEII